MIKGGGLLCDADAAVNSNNRRFRASKYGSEAHPRLCTGNPQGSYKLWTKAAELPKHKQWINKPAPSGRSGIAFGLG
jgi:hypothetical protein